MARYRGIDVYMDLLSYRATFQISAVHMAIDNNFVWLEQRWKNGGGWRREEWNCEGNELIVDLINALVVSGIL